VAGLRLYGTEGAVTMVPVLIVPLITEALRTLNFFLEGIPPNVRQAQALVWHRLWWPATKSILKLGGTTEEQLKEIEDLTK